jgi:glycosyltransferase involved in cell wall biosynthesis
MELGVCPARPRRETTAWPGGPPSGSFDPGRRRATQGRIKRPLAKNTLRGYKFIRQVSTLVRARAPTSEAGAARRSEVLLVPWMVAGVQTQYEQMRHTPGLAHARVIEVYPYRKGALIERLPLPSSVRGTIRSSLAAARSLPMRRVRAVWTQVALPMLPFLLTRNRRRVPVYYAIDCTPVQLHQFGGLYTGVDDPATPQGKLTGACLRLFFRRCAGLLPWSEWAARSMIRDYGAFPEKVHVIPPGIDLERWFPRPRLDWGRPRLLFVGADFERKGGPLLLDVYRRHLRDDCDLHLVTRHPVAPEPGLHVHSGLKVGDSQMQVLYQSSDALVLPTLADCFSMAALEAMACGLPVVISDVGAIPEIVVDGKTGMLIAPGRGDSLLGALRTILGSPSAARRLGRAGRRRAEQFYDARRQSATTLGIIGSIDAG